MDDFITETMQELNEYITNVRQDYMLHELSEASIAKDPVGQFGTWMQEAIGARVNEPNAMILATVSADGKPSARVLLLRGVNQDGFVFYTSYHSRKGDDVNANPNAAMTFFWPELQRQVRIEGVLSRIVERDSDKYFKSRPRENQLSAWAGQQSSPTTRKALSQRLEEVTQKFEGKDVPRPAWWGGFCLKPLKVEFWQGRPARFHDRILYTFNEETGWNITRLVP